MIGGLCIGVFLGWLIGRWAERSVADEERAEYELRLLQATVLAMPSTRALERRHEAAMTNYAMARASAEYSEWLNLLQATTEGETKH